MLLARAGRRYWRRGAAFLAVATVAACGGSPEPAAQPTPGTPPPRFGHVFIVVEENRNYADVIGNPAMPYLNGLAQQYGLATQYYADTHPSIGNYFMMTVGDTVTNNDGYTGTVGKDNVVRRLMAAGQTWKSYAEDLPAVGYDNPGVVGKYASRHVPLSYLTDVVTDSTQRRHLVPFTQLARDLAGDSLPAYGFIVPNLCHDAHDCAVDSADTWLSRNIDPLIKHPTFQRDGLLIIVYDESGNDNTAGGGRIVWVAVSAKSRTGYQSVALYQHASTLRFSLAALGVTDLPNAAAAAPQMGEFFTP
jgi:acid phosphatase